MLLSLSSAMRGRTAAAKAAPTSPTPAPSAGACHTPAPEASDSRRDMVVGETPEGAKTNTNASIPNTNTTTNNNNAHERPSATKKQRSIHDFFGSSRRVPTTPTTTLPMALDRKSTATLTRRSSSRSLPDSDERVTKRIDYDDTSSLDEGDDDDDGNDGLSLSLSQNSEAVLTTPQPRPPSRRTAAAAAVPLGKPKRIDFGGICPSSQRSEPDVEPTHTSVVVGPSEYGLARASSQSASQPFSGYGGYSAYGGGGLFSQDDMDFCTPADQPVVPMSHPTTPSPMKKRTRRSLSDANDEAQEDVQHLAKDLTHMDVRRVGHAAPLPSFSSSSDSSDMLLATPQRVLGLPTTTIPKRREAPPSLGSATPFVLAKGKAPPPSASESFTNPFAPVPAVDSRKRRKYRQSFPPTFGSNSANSFAVPYSRYLSEFVEQELLGSGAFSKVFKCVKKIDGWTYAIKKSKRHLRGRADTERALREVQALAALSDSRHVVRYFDAWIEDDLLYIQLEHCASCSLASIVDAHKPLHVPEETLCKVLCHLAQALQSLHAKQMVHMDVKLPNVLVAPGEVYKLGDLGTVALANGSMDITEGDNRYLSRELLEGSRANLKAGDVFALGATIYELALGTTLPSGGEEWQKLRDGDLSLFRQYSNSLQHLITSMMHPDPLQRPSADEILQHDVVLPYLPGGGR